MNFCLLHLVVGCSQCKALIRTGANRVLQSVIQESLQTMARGLEVFPFITIGDDSMTVSKTGFCTWLWMRRLEVGVRLCLQAEP